MSNTISMVSLANYEQQSLCVFPKQDRHLTLLTLNILRIDVKSSNVLKKRNQYICRSLSLIFTEVSLRSVHSFARSMKCFLGGYEVTPCSTITFWTENAPSCWVFPSIKWQNCKITTRLFCSSWHASGENSLFFNFLPSYWKWLTLSTS